MSKKLAVYDGVFTITDSLTGKLEFKALAIETSIDQVGDWYYFYYDTFINGDNIKKSRSIDHPYTLYQTVNGASFASAEQLLIWASENLGVIIEDVPGIISGYKADYDQASRYIYSAYYRVDVPFIVRTKDSVVTKAAGVLNLLADWDNRTNLIYG